MNTYALKEATQRIRLDVAVKANAKAQFNTPPCQAELN